MRPTSLASCSRRMASSLAIGQAQALPIDADRRDAPGITTDVGG
jgi:hypothetical protein